MTVLYDSDFDTTPPADETAIIIAAHTSGSAGIGAARMTTPNPGTNGDKIVWDSASPHTGSRCLRCDGGTPSTFHTTNFYEAGADLAHGYYRAYTKFSSIPAADLSFAAIYDSTPTITAQIRLTAAGHLALRNGLSTNVATSTYTLSANTWYGWEWHLDDAANLQTLRIYDATSSTAREEINGAFSSVTRRFQFGNVSAWPDGYSASIDDVHINDSAWAGGLGSPDPDSGIYRLNAGGTLTGFQIEAL